MDVAVSCTRDGRDRASARAMSPIHAMRERERKRERELYWEFSITGVGETERGCCSAVAMNRRDTRRAFFSSPPSCVGRVVSSREGGRMKDSVRGREREREREREVFLTIK